MQITQPGGDMTSRSFSSSVFTASFRSKLFQVHVDHAADCYLGEVHVDCAADCDLGEVHVDRAADCDLGL